MKNKSLWERVPTTKRAPTKTINFIENIDLRKLIDKLNKDKRQNNDQ